TTAFFTESVGVEADVADRAVLFPRSAAVVENEDRLPPSGDVLDDRGERVRKVIADDQRRWVTARRLFDKFGVVRVEIGRIGAGDPLKVDAEVFSCVLSALLHRAEEGIP